MCGNVGLLAVHAESNVIGVRVITDGLAPALKEPVAILREMIASTEIRGGQAGGVSAFEYATDAGAAPRTGRVRAIARKRYPLADDLAALFARKCPSGAGKGVLALSVVGHTRFATSSRNQLPELHPHDWGASGYAGEHRPFELETIWQWDAAAGALVPRRLPFGLHVSHNGDFDAAEVYSELVLNDQLGRWLERALRVPNSTTGDSPKLAGLLELLRVQGRWGPAARMAWLRAICRRLSDVSGGEGLDAAAPHRGPTAAQWQTWARFFEAAWATHAAAVVVRAGEGAGEVGRYRIARAGVRALCDDLRARLADRAAREALHPGAGEWLTRRVAAFCHHAVRGFLRADLHTALTEALHKAHGSFGVQAHCTAEPGVVALGCKGQPLGVACSPHLPLVLFGSEAAALRVAVTADGRPHSALLDMDELGETIRIGPPPALLDGEYAARRGGAAEPVGLALGGGLVELRAYSLHRACEARRAQLEARCWPIDTPTPAFAPLADLVGADLRETPAALAAIDAEWARAASPTRAAASALGAHLLERMALAPGDAARADGAIDLLIGGVEVSLWLAQQLAADLRALFPALTVKCVSTNKLLGVSGFSPRRTFFAGNERVRVAQLRGAAVLLVSQSGQTFPSLHAARLLCQLAPDRVWLLTGTPASKMEAALVSARLARGEAVDAPRVLLTLSGHRPAEPSSLAVAATHHTMTHLLLHLAAQVRARAPSSRTVQPWQLELAAGGRPAGSPSRGAERDLLITVSDYCIADMRTMAALAAGNLAQIVGCDVSGRALPCAEVRALLLAQGARWAAHVHEAWRVLVLAGAFLVVTLVLGVSIVELVVRLALRGAGVDASLRWSLDQPHEPAGQPAGWTALGFAVRLADALIYAHGAKLFTWGSRLVGGRPLWARHGKRTLVIVETATNHQLLEAFVSKLFAQAYAIVSVDVHGAAGVDHFVHRFTHRVTRGVLIAVGRPDGRLCCLAKTEASLLLACKQAAFIQNPAYPMAAGSGNAPEIVSVGHNPFKPDGLVAHVPLPSESRRRFVDEVVYESLHQGQSDLHHVFKQLPFGAHFIPPEDRTSALAGQPAAQFIGVVSKRIAMDNGDGGGSNEPNARLAFATKLDARTHEVQDRQLALQQFYECRVAALERYVALAVMFHAMALDASRPWLLRPWNIARSQSNLRVATTASPISASDTVDDDEIVLSETRARLRVMAIKLRGVVSHF